MKKNIGKFTQFYITRIGVTCLPITKKRIRTNVSNPNIRFIFPPTLNFTMIFNHTCFTIRQNNTLNFLKFVFFLELRKNLMQWNKRFIQRSSRQTQTSRSRIWAIRPPTKRSSKTENILHLVIQCLSIYLTSKKIHHRKPFANLNQTIFFLISKFTKICFTILIISHQRIITSKSINFKRNRNFLAEPNQIEKLLDCIQHHISHWTRPI